MKPLPFEQVRWATDRQGIVVLDQTRLPNETVEIGLATIESVEEAIGSLRVRGAPLIGITAAMGVAALVNRASHAGVRIGELTRQARELADRLEVTRPTAVNLTWAMNRMRRILDLNWPTGRALAEALMTEAQAIHDEDRKMCRAIGEHGAELLREGSRVLTHCNAGALATGGIGTALAPVYLAAGRGMAVHVFADETRPLLQGSRITAWELTTAGIDVTVVTDGMAAALMSTTPPDLVFVGADRIAANGDVANKIGTFGLAVLAQYHEIPFYVLAPTSTIDPTAGSGSDIPIEHRPGDEIRKGFGRTTAPEDAGVWSPAFDVTPAALVTAIITEEGRHLPPFPESLPRVAR